MRIEGNGKARVVFDGCTFNAGRYDNFGYFFGKGLLSDPLEKLIIRNSIFSKRNGDPRDPNVEPEIYDDYNRKLMWLMSANATQNNKIFIPHQDNTVCYCNESGGYAVKPTCWYIDACTIHETISTLKAPRAYWGGYCDIAGVPNSGLYCLNFEPDGYTDIAYTNPTNLPCVLKYENPIFTQPYINILPPPWVPGSEVAPLYWLLPLENACFSNLRKFQVSRYNEQESRISIFPIPATDIIHVTGGILGENAYIYNMVGKLILAGRVLSNDHIMYVGDLPSGVYYLITDSKMDAVKIIITQN